MDAKKQTELFPAFAQNLASRGCFLVTGTLEKPNVMTVGWSTAGVMWGKQVLMVPVRLSRYSHELLEQTGQFTICVPSPEQPFLKELGVVGSKSGRDMDKFAELNLKALPSEQVSAPRIEGTGEVYECSVLYKLEMTEANLDQAIRDRYYAAADYHTLYFAEILCCHKF